MRPTCSLPLIALLAAAPAAAQDLTDEELLRRFEAQRDAFAAAREGDLGATRGLELITVEDLTTEPEVAAAPTAAPAAQPVPEAPLAQTEAAAPPELPGAETAEAPEPLGEAAPDLAAAGALPEPGAPDEAVGATVAAAAEPVVFGQLDEALRVDLRIVFPFDSAVLTEDQLPKLEQLCNVMRQSDISLFRIVGHTDAAGSDAYNERLSLLRAEEVERYFVRDCGLEPSRLEAVGMGERFLDDPADPRAPENRRVEFQALS